MKIKVASILIILFWVVGCVGNEEDFDQHALAKMEESAENFIREYYDGIESVELTEPYRNETNTIKARGLVNGEYSFTITFNEDYTVSGIGEGEDFPKLKTDK